jgi:ribose transport system permease protein
LKGFLTVGNLFALSRNISILGILALGMAIVVIARGHDLSQVASLAVSTAIVIIVMNAGYPTAVALLIGLALAIAIGVLNGFLISVIEMPPLLTTVRRQRL